jgi:hypothetical protein
MAQQLAEWAPADLQKVRQLVNEHKRLKGAPLVLALYYVSSRAPKDISILEVIESSGSNSVDPDKELFEVTFDSTPGFQMKDGQRLRLVLTNPRELRVAIRENWPLVREIRKAFQRGRALVISNGRKAGDLLEELRG